MRYFIFFLLLPLFSFAQEGTGKNPNVELPEFVITGQDLMNLQQSRKPPAEQVPVISEDFVKPPIDPETPELRDIGGPESLNPSLRDTVNYRTGHLKALVGVYTLPLVDASIASPYTGGLFEAFLRGENTRPYVDNAEKYFLNAGLALSLFTDYGAAFLPGAVYKINGDFSSKSFKFFAGNEPALKRELYNVNFGASVDDIYMSRMQFGLSADDKITLLRNEEFTENLFSLNGYIKGNPGSFYLGGNITYQNQIYSDSNTSSSKFNYFSLRPYAGFELTKVLKASFGITYSHQGTNDFLVPYAALTFRLMKDLTVSGEYIPGGEFITSSGFLEKNIYFNPQRSPNLFVKKTHDIKAALKYEFSRYYEMNGGFIYRSYKNLPYFSVMSPDGRFSNNVSEAESYGAFLNLLFHSGPFGYFYGSAEALSTTDNQNKYIPYFPSVISSLTYGYNFPGGINAEAKLLYRSAAYTDIANTDKISSYVNLGFSLAYNITGDLKLVAGINNLLDRDNMIWDNYRESPMDLSAGISYVW